MANIASVNESNFAAQVLQSGKPVISNVYTIEPIKKKVIFMMMPLKDGDGKITGIAGGILGPTERFLNELLREIPGLELVEVPDGEQCCGSAGIYNLVEPASADEIGRRKAQAVLSTGAALLASANPGCSLQIRRMLEERGAQVEERC